MRAIAKDDSPAVAKIIRFPRELRLHYIQRKQIFRTSRFLLWCIANFLLWPIVRPFVKKLKLVHMVFVVYPGSKRDTNAYVPLWFRGFVKRYFCLSVIGIITRGQGKKRGIVIAIAEDPSEFSAEDLLALSGKIRKFSDGVGIKSIALAGRLPGIFLANKITVDLPFRKGDQGTVFTVTETVQFIAAHEGISFNDTVGVLGVGFIGGKVLRRLKDLGYRSLIGFDPRTRSPFGGNHIITNDFNLLSRCKMVIVLTAKGSDIAELIPYLNDGTIVIDDTHPQLPSEIVEKICDQGGRVYKTALGLTGVYFVPELPGYDKKWLPGCVIEALVNGEIQRTQDSFDHEGRELGLKPFLVSPKGQR